MKALRRFLGQLAIFTLLTLWSTFLWIVYLQHDLLYQGLLSAATR
jgi:hypothetical protein